MRVSRFATTTAALAILCLPAASLADTMAAEPVVTGEVLVEETSGNVEDVIVGGAIAPTEGAEGQDLGKWSSYAQPGDLVAVPPSGAKGGNPHLDRTKRVFLSIGSTIGSVLYFPIKLVVGVAGAWTGGVAGALTGGDQATAAGIWNVTTDGDYFVSPEEMTDKREFRLTGDHR